jgi:hypothetical protein
VDLICKKSRRDLWLQKIKPQNELKKSKCPLTTQKNSPIYGKLRKTYLAPIKVERNLNKKKI